ncbi:MAG TPA: hypothetical protein VFV49_16215 [Thermoanaerobaculia bacterium]|nr:hypothetical protein [Thermoanaerobaculia bacterium]
MHKLIRALGESLLLVFLLVPVLEAQAFRVAVSGLTAGDACIILPIAFPRVVWLNPDVMRDDPVTIASGDGERVLGLLDTLGISVVEVFPNQAPQPFFSGLPGQQGHAIAVAPNGRVFVSYSSPAAPAFRGLAVISPTGTLEATYPLPASTLTHDEAEIAVMPDSCTVLFAQSGGIGRINGCTGAPLPDFVATGGTVHDIQPLPAGDVLVAIDQNIELFNGAGGFVRTVANLSSYSDFAPTDQPEEVAFFGGFVWIVGTRGLCAGATLLRISLADGTELARSPVALDLANGLVVGAATGDIPTLSPVLLILLTLSLVIVGTFMMRFR